MKLGYHKLATTIREAAGILVPVAVFAVVVIVAAGWFYVDQSAVLKNEAVEKVEAIGRLQATGLEEWREARLAEVEVFYDNPAFMSLVRRVFIDEDLSAVGDLSGWLGKLEANPAYEGVFLVDVDGQADPRFAAGTGYLDSHVEHTTREALRTGGIVWIDLHQDDDNGHPHMTIVAPIVDRPDDTPVGALILTIDPEEYVYPLLATWPLPSRTGESLLVRRAGDGVVYLSPLRFIPDSVLEFRVPIEDDHLPAVRGVLGFEGAVEDVDYRGEQVLAAVNRIPGTEWVLVSKLDASEAYAMLSDRRAVIVAVVAGLLVTAVGLGLFVVRGQRLNHLREREWLRSVIETSHDEIYACDADSLEFTFVNAGAVRRLGYSREEFLGGMRIFDLKSGIPEETVREQLQLLRTGEWENLLFEVEHQRKDGTRYPVDVSVQHTRTGKGERFLAIGIDRTERAQAESAMRRRLDHEQATAACMRILLEEGSLAEGLDAVLETLFATSGASRVYMFRYGEDAEQRRTLNIVHERVAPGIAATIDDPEMHDLPYELADSMLLPAIQRYEPFARIVDELGEDEADVRRILEGQGVRSLLMLPIYVGGEQWGLLGFDDCEEPRRWDDDDVRLLQVVADGIGAALARQRTEFELAQHREHLEVLVEERTRELESANAELETANAEFEHANAELETANTAKARFLGNMSHELRTPLNSIIGFSGILGQGLSGELTDEQTKQIRMINRSGQHLLALINDILDLTKIEAGAVAMSLERFELAEVVRDVAATIEPLAAEKGLELQVDLTRVNGSRLESDCGKVRQILLNLAGNAVKFTRSGSVRLAVDPTDDGFVSVHVSDTGPGIPFSVIDQIFEPFVQLDSEDVAKPGGTGLGLSVSTELARLLGGTLTVQSEEGEGSTFTLTLPLARAV